MQKKLKECRQINIVKRIIHIIEDIVYYAFLIPLTLAALIVVYQTIRYPDRIPDVFGYKIFMIMDEYMDDSVKFGDLVFTKNIATEKINIGDIIAFRNGQNTVTIHRVIDISEDKNSDTDENTKMFTMNTLENETLDTKYVSSDKIEGKLVHTIPKIGLIIMIIQDPLITVSIILVILIIGLIIYYIAQELDMRDIRLMELKKQEEQTKSEIATNSEKKEEKAIK